MTEKTPELGKMNQMQYDTTAGPFDEQELLNTSDEEKLKRVDLDSSKDEIFQKPKIEGDAGCTSSILSPYSPDISYLTVDNSINPHETLGRNWPKCKGLTSSIMNILNARPCFFLNISIFMITFAFLMTCLLGFVPMAAERQSLAGNLNDTTRLFQQCSSSYNLLKGVHEKTSMDLTSCTREIKTTHELLDARQKEIGNLNNAVSDLKSTLKTKDEEATRLVISEANLKTVVSDLKIKLEAKENEANDLIKGHAHLKNLVSELNSELKQNNDLNNQISVLHSQLTSKQEEMVELLNRLNSKTSSQSAGFMGCFSNLFSAGASVRSSQLMFIILAAPLLRYLALI